MQVDVELLSCTEGVTLGETDLRHRTETTIRTPDGVTFDIEVVRLVERAGQA